MLTSSCLSERNLSVQHEEEIKMVESKEKKIAQNIGDLDIYMAYRIGGFS